MSSTPSQLINQATRHAFHLERLKSHDVRVLREILRDIQTQLLGRLARSDITEWTRSRAERQLAAYTEMLQERYGRDILPALNRQIRELAEYEAGFEVRSLGNVAPRHNFLLPTDSQIMTAVTLNPLTMRGPGGGQLLESFIETWANTQITRTVSAVRSGFALGQTTPQVIAGLREAFVGQERDLATVVRTSLQHAAAEARQATWERNSDIVKKVRWVSTLDDRTSQQCQAMDGMEFDIDKGPRPPAHPNCRSTIVAVLDDRFAVLSEGATRAERDPVTGKVGSAPAKQTFYQWLKNEPAEVQDDILGPTRGRLFRDGGLSAQRFAELQIGKQFEPLTLEQMRQLDPVAFMRAGL